MTRDFALRVIQMGRNLQQARYQNLALLCEARGSCDLADEDEQEAVSHGNLVALRKAADLLSQASDQIESVVGVALYECGTVPLGAKR